MRGRLVRDYRFEAARRLPNIGAEHPCAGLHGHGFTVAITIEGKIETHTGWIMDFAAIDAAVEPAIAALDHRYLNDVPELANPTSEHLAVWLWRAIAPRLPLLVEVSVSETPTTRAIYRGE